MSSDTDLVKLYSGKILQLAGNVGMTERLPDPQVTVRKRSPLCGSTVTIDVDMEDGHVARFGQEVKACALGQASAAVLGDVVVGLGKDDITRGRDQLRAMLKSNGPVPEAPFDGLEALSPAADFKNRHASILLAFDATVEALQQAEDSKSTG